MSDCTLQECVDDYLRVKPEEPKVEPVCSPKYNKIREINIQEVNRGYIVRVGCHTFAISTKEELMPKLEQYINSPEDTERKWNDGSLFLTF